MLRSHYEKLIFYNNVTLRSSLSRKAEKTPECQCNFVHQMEVRLTSKYSATQRLRACQEEKAPHMFMHLCVKRQELRGASIIL